MAGLLNEKLQRFDPITTVKRFAVKVGNLEYRSTLVENRGKTSDVLTTQTC